MQMYLVQVGAREGIFRFPKWHKLYIPSKEKRIRSKKCNGDKGIQEQLQIYRQRR